jgi:hypothetical protein
MKIIAPDIQSATIVTQRPYFVIILSSICFPGFIQRKTHAFSEELLYAKSSQSACIPFFLLLGNLQPQSIDSLNAMLSEYSGRLMQKEKHGGQRASIRHS